MMAIPFIRGLLLALMTLTAASGLASEQCPERFSRLPIQAGGRVKPLQVHAKEVIKFISGKDRCGELSATEAYCEWSLASITKTPSSCALSIHIDHPNTRKLLGMDRNDAQIDPNKAQAAAKSLEYAYADLQNQKLDKSSAAKDLAATLSKIALYTALVAGHDWGLPVVHEDRTHWVSVRDLHDIKQQDFNSPGTIVPFIKKLEAIYLTKVGDDHLLEWRYDQLQLFRWALFATLLALIVTALSKQGLSKWAAIALGLVFAIEIAGITMRIAISGRGPVTNMYETVMWVGLGALLFASMLSFIRKEKAYVLCGLALNILCLFMVNFAHTMLNPSIDPLVPVLRDNFWLSTHVTTVTISYAAFALSWGLANYRMLTQLLGRRADVAYWNELIYDAIKIGVVLIAAGVILGGIWADYSWGRFWGWDPKETWALIVLMTYLAILHGRHAGWIHKQHFIPLVAAAFLTVIMAWFGVNYILATGLHSYGFSEGGSIFIAALVLIQLAILVLYGIKTKQGI